MFIYIYNISYIFKVSAGLGIYNREMLNAKLSEKNR